jgi:putative NIF3 family GTP cyclohydrolase 1 type 2
LPVATPLAAVWEAFTATLRANRTPDGSSFFAHDYNLEEVRLFGEPTHSVRKIAIGNGSGNSFVNQVIFRGADLFITGEIDYHHRLDCLAQGVAVVEMGHFLSEAPMRVGLAAWLRAQRELADVEVLISTQGAKAPSANPQQRGAEFWGVE